MKVSLAGYNIDSSLIKQLNTESATPEVISAAYARISRSHKSVTELRAEALHEVRKARKSNQNIIFELGHSSIAEHAVFNFDIIGISRLLTETIETIRFASFTEKSQRYVTFDKDYVVPQELDGYKSTSLRSSYNVVMQGLFAEYEKSFAALTELYSSEYPDLSPTEREGKAKEDARYILPLATRTQLGMTINARSLENLLKRLANNPLQEAQELYKQLQAPISDLCPSLLRYTEKDSFTGTFTPTNMRVYKDDFALDERVRVLNMTFDPDVMILTALLFEQTKGDFAHCREKIDQLDHDAKLKLWRQIYADIKPWHKMHRAFELVDFTFELRMSESCWAQFKRHRIGTMIKQQNPSPEPYTMPYCINQIGRSEQWETLLQKLDNLRPALRKMKPDLSPYIKLNADKVKVLVKMNLRELYHFVRLRSDEHAQWEIRDLSHEMTQHLYILCPHAAAYICGKSEMRATPPER